MKHGMLLIATITAIGALITCGQRLIADDDFFASARADAEQFASEADAEARRVIVMSPQRIEVVDESALRRRLAWLQAEQAKLYTRTELVALIDQTEQAIEDRRTELVERKKSFDEKMEAIRVQLSELSDEAASVGADIPLELILNGIDQAKKSEGVPRETKSASRRNFDSNPFQLDADADDGIDQF